MRETKSASGAFYVNQTRYVCVRTATTQCAAEESEWYYSDSVRHNQVCVPSAPAACVYDYRFVNHPSCDTSVVAVVLFPVLVAYVWEGCVDREDGQREVRVAPYIVGANVHWTERSGETRAGVSYLAAEYDVGLRWSADECAVYLHERSTGYTDETACPPVVPEPDVPTPCGAWGTLPRDTLEGRALNCVQALLP